MEENMKKKILSMICAICTIFVLLQSPIILFFVVLIRNVRKAHSFSRGRNSTNNVYVEIENIHILMI